MFYVDMWRFWDMENVSEWFYLCFYLAHRSVHLVSLIMARFDWPGEGLIPNLKAYFVL